MTFEPGDILKVRPTCMEVNKYKGTYLLEKCVAPNALLIDLKRGAPRLYQEFILSGKLEEIFSVIDHVDIPSNLKDLNKNTKELLKQIPGLEKYLSKE